MLRRLGEPTRGSRLDALLRKAIIPSDDRAANDLLTWLGGSTSGGAAYVDQLFRALGMDDTDMYGGYIVTQGQIPIRTGAQPSFVGKRTTAADLATLMRSLNLAAVGQGGLARRGFRPSQARFLLYLLAHSQVSRIVVSASRSDRGAPEGRLDQHRVARHRPRLLAGRKLRRQCPDLERPGSASPRMCSQAASGAPPTPGSDVADYDDVLDRIRELCLALPETSERLSHGHPTFFVRDKRSFAMVLNGHHGDRRFALWCAAEDGVQQMLVEADPSGSSARRTWATAAAACASTRNSTGKSSRGSSRTPTSRSRLRGWSRRRDAAPRRSRPAGAAAQPRPERRPPEDAPGDADGEQREDRGAAKPQL